MCEGMHAVDPRPGPNEFPGAGGGDARSGVVDAAHGVDDPELVANADAPIRPAMALERRFTRRPGEGRRPELAEPAGVEIALQRARQIVAVHVLTGGDRLRGDADRVPVLDHRV